MEETTRQKKFARLIQKELSNVFQKEAREYAGNSLLTITTVRTSVDLSLAKIYVSFFPKDKQEEKLEKLQSGKYNIKKLLGDRIRKEVRIIPDIVFFLDDTFDEAEKINTLIDSLDIPETSEEDE
ncbi:MAG: 30S ribosome-binding factor RbfA [Thermoflexibacter sp.]|jgi:ribosome-binding factor A|nr:30S ribosome-binding factor RbfA [Thermoflexibacter sp.]